MVENEWVTGVILLMDKIRLTSWYAKCPYVLDQDFSINPKRWLALGISEESTVPLLLGDISSPFISGFRAHLCRRCLWTISSPSQRTISATVVGNYVKKFKKQLVVWHVKICGLWFQTSFLCSSPTLGDDFFISLTWVETTNYSWMIILCSFPGSPLSINSFPFFFPAQSLYDKNSSSSMPAGKLRWLSWNCLQVDGLLVSPFFLKICQVSFDCDTVDASEIRRPTTVLDWC